MDYLIKNITTLSPEGAEVKTIYIKDGIISDVDYYEIANESDTKFIDGKNLVAVSTFANAHLHLGETIFRGKCDGMNLKEYLTLSHSFFENEDMIANEEYLHGLTAQLTLFEAMHSGTGCIGCSRGHREVRSLGLEGVCGIPFIRIEKLNRYVQNFPEIFEKNRESDGEGVYTGIFIQGLRTIQPKDLRTIARLQDRFGDIRIMIHLSETNEDVTFCLDKYKKRPVEYLDSLGLLTDKTLCVHLVHLDDNEITLIKDKKANAVFCPAANLKLGSGIPSIEKFYQKNIPFSLATDGLAVCGSASLLEQAKLASLITGGRVPNNWLLKAITETPYNALGFKNKGKITKGKKADLALFKSNPAALFPTDNPLSQFIHNNSSFRCCHMWVNGKLVVCDSEIMGYDERPITELCMKALN
jgi:5-methylthioadenosine/S-adenosylhomocysteine deaminase